MRSCKQTSLNQAPPVPIQRFFYSTGQMLRSADLNSMLRVAEARRLWHNRALHNAFGLSDGLTASAVSDKKLNLVGVEISPGLAYDCVGAPLLLQTALRIPIPANVPDSVAECFLLARQPQASSSSCSCSSSTRCCLGERIPAESWVEFVWKDAAIVRSRDGVPLVRVTYPVAQSTSAKKVSARRLAQVTARRPQLDIAFQPPRIRPIQRSHIVCDRTIPGATDWKQGSFLNGSAINERIPLDWQAITVSIDTSAAGFKGVPCYFAEISGSLLDEVQLEWLPAAFPYITDETPTSFTFGFWIPAFAQDVLRGAVLSHQPFDSQVGSVIGFDNFSAYARRKKLFVTWFGCEMPAPAVPIRRAHGMNLFCGCGSALEGL